MDSHSAGLIEEIKRAFSMVRNSRGWAKFIEIHQLILQGYSENGSEANYAGLFHGIKLTATHTTKTPTTGHMVTLQLFAPGAQNPREMVVMYSED